MKRRQGESHSSPMHPEWNAESAKHTALGRREMNEVDARRESASKRFSDCMNYLTVNVYTPGYALFSYLSDFESRSCDMLGHLC